jgi:hypothetical protein
MLKTDHRQISIDAELLAMEHIAGRLRQEGLNRCICDDAVSLVTAEKGPTPLVELFNWSHAQADKNRAFIALRDTLSETILLLARFGRHCRKVHDQFDQPTEPFDEVEIADRLDGLARKLARLS